MKKNVLYMLLLSGEQKTKYCIINCANLSLAFEEMVACVCTLSAGRGTNGVASETSKRNDVYDVAINKP